MKQERSSGRASDSPNPSAHFTGGVSEGGCAALSTTIIKRLVGVLAAVALALGISAATAGPADASDSV